MRKVSIAVLSAFVVMIGANVMANTVWDGGGGDDYWSNPLNWGDDQLPSTEGDSADIRNQAQVVVASAVSANGLQLKGTDTGVLLEIEDGGTVTMVNDGDGRAFITRNTDNIGTVRVNEGGAWYLDRPGGVSGIYLGDDVGTEGYLQVYGGTVAVTNNLQVGGGDADAAAYGEFEITGGSMVAGGNLTFADSGVGTAVGKFHGGVTKAGSLGTGTGADLEFKNDGKLILDGDATDQIADLTASGVARGTNGTLHLLSNSANGVTWDYDITNPGQTTVWAVIPEPATISLLGLMGVGALFVRRFSRG